MTRVLLAALLVQLWLPARAWGEETCPGASASFAGGDGSADCPYLIETADQLNNVRNDLSAHYKLIADIDLAGTPYGVNWEPIGTQAATFKGTFDGDGHKIINLIIDLPPQISVGLFSKTGSGAVIRNIGLVNANVTGWGVVGGLVGENFGSITNVYSTNANLSAANNGIGGLVGYNSGSIAFSYAKGSVIGGSNVGGLVGFNLGSITDSYAMGSVTANDENAGGLVGANYGAITNTYAAGTVYALSTHGGLVGYQNGDNVNNSYYDRDISGRSDSGKGEPKYTWQMIQQSTFDGWNFEVVWYIRDGETYPHLRWEDQSGFAAIPDSPGNKVAGEAFNLLINDARDFFGEALDGEFNVTVTSDQDGEIHNKAVAFDGGNAKVTILLGAPGTHSLEVRVQAEGDTVSESLEVFVEPFAGGNGDDLPYLIANAWQLHNVRYYPDDDFKLMADLDLGGFPDWEPIGTQAQPFEGAFDGNGKVIENLTADSGLFGETGASAVFRNVRLENVNISGGSADDIGGLVSVNRGTIADSYIKGTVSGNDRVGGLAGANHGTITRSYTEVDVAGNEAVGGMAGENNGTIENVYAKGDVSGSNAVGGLSGSGIGDIAYSYVTGAVSASGDDVGGLAGSSGVGVTNSYYIGASGDLVDNGIGEPKSEEQMKRHSTFADWDFDDTWYIHDGHTYPRLRWEEENWPDHSEFEVELEEEGGKIYGEPFNLSIIGAMDEFGQTLNGYYPVTVFINPGGVLFNQPVELVGGNATVAVLLESEGKHTLVVRVGGIADAETVDVNVIAQLERIVVTTNKTVYFVGDELDLDAIEVKAVYSGGRQEMLNIADVSISGFDSGEAREELEVTLTYGGKAATLTVVIVPEPDTEAPTVPANLRVTGKTATSVSLAWDASADNTGVNHYEVEVRQGSGEWVQADTPVDTAHTRTGLSPATEYTFRVRAVDGAGNASGWSDELNVVTDPAEDEGDQEDEDSGGTDNGDTDSGKDEDDNADNEDNDNEDTDNGNDSGNPGGDNSGSTGNSGNNSAIRDRFIDINGKAILPDEIDTSGPSVPLPVEPTDGGSTYVTIPAPILNDFAAQNPELVLEIEAPFGGYRLPVALPSLVPDWDKLLEANGWNPETIGFRLTLEDRTEDPEIREVLANQLPGGGLIGAVVNVHLDIVDTDTGEALTELNRFLEPVVRKIPVSSESFDPSANWGAFRYDEASGGFVFVPARLEEKDGRLCVVILSRSNSVYVAAASEVSFADAERHWGKAYAEQAAAKGLVNGVGGGKFAPDRAVTRAEFAAMLVRALGQGVSSGGAMPYTDVPRSAWYYDEIAQAKAIGLLDFIEGDRFLPNRTLTRGEMASMLAAALKLEGLEADADGFDPNRYRDIGQADVDYLEAIRTVMALGIMNGTGDGLFNPKGETTRAQAAAVLLRTLNTLGWID